MTDTVYAVDGGLEDWAYAASWENSVNNAHPITNCNAYTLGGYKIDSYNDHSYRCAMLLVEMDNQKTPSQSRLGKGQQDIRTGDGLVPKFARMCLAAVDLADPYFVVESISPTEYTQQDFTVVFTAWGCIEAHGVAVEVVRASGAGSTIHVGDGPCVYQNDQASFNTTLPFDTDSFRITGSFDKQWESQSDPDPSVPPQSHLVRARRQDNYTVQYENGLLEGSLHRQTDLYELSQHPTNITETYALVQELTAFLVSPKGEPVGNVTLTYNLDTLVVQGFSDLTSTAKLYMTQYGDMGSIPGSLGSGYDIAKCQSSASDPGFLGHIQSSLMDTIKVCQTVDMRSLSGRALVLMNNDGTLAAYGALEVISQSTDLGSAPGSGICVLETTDKSLVYGEIQFIDDGSLALTATANLTATFPVQTDIKIVVETVGEFVLSSSQNVTRVDDRVLYHQISTNSWSKGAIGHKATVYLNNNVGISCVVAQGSFEAPPRNLSTYISGASGEDSGFLDGHGAILVCLAVAILTLVGVLFGIYYCKRNTKYEEITPTTEMYKIEVSEDDISIDEV